MARFAFANGGQLIRTGYQLSPRTLGLGGQGRVLAAIELKTRRQVACKLIDLHSHARQVMRELGMLRGESLDTAANQKQQDSFLRKYRHRLHKRVERIREEHIVLGRLSHVRPSAPY